MVCVLYVNTFDICMLLACSYLINTTPYTILTELFPFVESLFLKFTDGKNEP